MKKISNKQWLESHGWTSKKSKLNKIEIVFWYQNKEDAFGLHEEMALKVQKNICQEQEIKDRMQKGIAKIPCNKCGEECGKKEGNMHHGYYGLINAKFSTGFFSEPLDDGLTYTFSMCEKCLYAMFKDFKIKPNNKEFL